MKKLLLVICLLVNFSYAANLTMQSVSIDDQAINYYKVGQGSPVILIMGYGLTNNFWPQPFINCLSKEHTVYILDYIKAAKPDINLVANNVYKFINKLDLNHPEVIGWSMGGGIALTLANNYPHSVSKLGLISSIVAEPSISQIVPPYVAKTNSTNEKLNYIFSNNIYEYKPKNLLKYKKQMISDQIFVSDEILNWQKSMLANWMADSDNSSMIRHIRIPANVVISEHDAILNPQVELHAFKQYTKADITIVNAGHASFYQVPEQVCGAVLN